jgi:hypothetical protein
MRIYFLREDLKWEERFGQDISPEDAFQKIFDINFLHDQLDVDRGDPEVRRDFEENILEKTLKKEEGETLKENSISDIKSRFTRSKELLKKLRGLIGSEPIDLQCGQKVSIPQPPRAEGETPAFLSFEDGIEIKFIVKDRNGFESERQLRASVFVEADIDPAKSFIECINRCCPTRTPIVAPEPTEGGEQITPFGQEEEEGTLLAPPTTGDIGTGGGAGGAGSVSEVAETCENFTIEGATVIREGERVKFTINVNFTPAPDKMFSSFAGVEVRDAAGNFKGAFGRQSHAGVTSTFGSAPTGEVPVTAAVSDGGKTQTLEVSGSAVASGGTAKIIGGCKQSQDSNFIDKARSLIFDTP